MLAFEKLHVGRVGLHHLCARQLLGDGASALAVLFDQPRREPPGAEQVGDVVPDLAAAEDHHVLVGAGRVGRRERVGEGVDALRRADDDNPVAGLDHALPVGNDHVVVSQQCRKRQRIVAVGLLYRLLDDGTRLADLEFGHLDAAVGEGIDIDRGGEPDDADDRLGS